MQIDSIICPPDHDFPLYIAAKRYSLKSPSPSSSSSNGGLTLILLHSTSFHKEIWEPLLEHLFFRADSSGIYIKEAFAIDCPNHGESAVLNHRLLGNIEFGCQMYAEYAYHFILNCGVDFSRKNLVGIGHSLGGVSVTILNTLMQGRLQFQSLLLIEPLFLRDIHLERLRKQLINLAYERRDVWPTRQDALKGLKNTGWHPKVVDSYVTHGIRDHPSASHSVSPYTGVTLACTREQEALMYRDPDGSIKSEADLDIACMDFPVHIFWGQTADYIPKTVQTDLMTNHKFASVNYVANTGHLAIHQDPEAVAFSLFKTLNKFPSARSQFRTFAKL